MEAMFDIQFRLAEQQPAWEDAAKLRQVRAELSTRNPPAGPRRVS